MQQYIIRNDVTGKVFMAATSGEAKLYAIGGVLSAQYSVFFANGGALPLTVYEIVK